MVSLTTQRITVSAKSTYQSDYSEPNKRQYVFSYQIRITNNGVRPVQLLSRAWEVIDATAARRRVDGEGVVGEQPLIAPGQSYEYTSWVQFETPIGAMRGSYVMQRIGRNGPDGMFQVAVPKFLHIAPEMLN